MKAYHGDGKVRQYFEGWYFKQVGDSAMLALIPGISIDENGKGHCFLQILTDEKALSLQYPIGEFYADARRLFVRVGSSYFTEKGIFLNVHQQGVELTGFLRFGHFSPLAYDIMGPFACLPSMECQHGILSTAHVVEGEVRLNGRMLRFHRGQGYLEKDRGSSFPSSYFWAQCNMFEGVSCDLTAAVATIPYGGFQFTGLIASLTLAGREYRIATYNGGRVLCLNAHALILQRGAYRLALTYPQGGGLPLAAPQGGGMSRTIHENASCSMALKFWKNGRLIYRGVGRHGGLEIVGY